MRPEPVVSRISASAPSGTTFCTPVKAVPPGGLVVVGGGGVTVVGLTVGGSLVVVGGSVVVVGGGVVVVGGGVVVVGGGVVVVGGGVVVVGGGVVVVGGGVVVVGGGVVVVGGGVVVVGGGVVVVVPGVHDLMSRMADGTAPCPFHSQVADAVVLPAGVPGPGTEALNCRAPGLIENCWPFTVSTTLKTNWAFGPNP